VWLVLVIAFAAGACSVFSQTALAVVVRDLFPAAGLIRANSVLELASQLSLVAGPAVVGVLAAVGSIGLALLADALTFLASLLSLFAVGRWRPGPAGAAANRTGRGWRGMGADLRAGLRYVASVRVLVILTAVQMVVNLCLAVEKLIVFYARDTLGLTPSLVAAVVAAGGAGGVAGALAASRLAGWIGEIRLIVTAVAAAGAAIATMSVAGSAPSLMAANGAYTWAVVVASLVNRTQRQRIVPRAMLGRVTSGVRVLFLAVDPIGVVIAGTATSALGGDPRPVFLAAGTVIVVTAGAGWLAGLRRAGHDGGGARK
jgi:Na+/melibiose symporter-like transporter